MKKRTQLLFTTKDVLTYLFAFVLLLGTNIATAHVTGCDHHHEGIFDTSIDCDDLGAACTHRKVKGTCQTKIGSNYRDCICTAKKKKQQIFEIGNMAGVIDHVPTAFGLTTLTFTDMQGTAYSIWDGDSESTEMQDDFISGKMQFRFGSFENLSRVPVYIVDADFTIKSYTYDGQISGENVYTLNDNGNRNFLYDANKGYVFVETYEDNIHLTLQNNIVGKTDITYPMEAFLYSDSKTARLRVQGVYEAVGLSANASSTSSLGLLLTLALMGMVLFGFSYSFKKKIS